MSFTQVEPPALWLRLLESRAIGELYAYAWSYPWLHLAPRGDGHPVLVIPGFLASGSSTFPLRHTLKRIGYKGHRWKLGRNMGPLRVELEKVMERMQELRSRYGRKVTLVGWSLGGLYARELAWMAPDVETVVLGLGSPDDVRQIITLGTPFRHHDSTAVNWLYTHLNGHHSQHISTDVLDRLEEVPPVPSTSIYSRGDGIVPWRCSLERPSEFTENIRVYGSHCGLGHNPAVLWAVLDRLAQAEGEWRPFERKLARSFVYPRPDGMRRRDA